MEDRNRNQGGGYQQQNSNWQNDQERYNRPHNQSQQYDSNYNRNNDNDQNWNKWQNSGNDDYQRNQGGQYGNDYNSKNRGFNQQGSQQGAGSGNQQWRDNNWNRSEDQWGSAGMYGGDFGRDDWERGNTNRQGGRQGSGQNQNRNWQDSNYGGYSPGFNEQNQYSGNRSRQDYNRRNEDRGWWDRTRDEVSSWFGDDDAERRRNNEKRSGGHRGKGPKDYQRSSERIREDVCDRLSDDDALDATHIQVQVQGNEVILSGTVNERYQKRYAEDLVESISGVRHVENRIRVGGTSGDLSAHDYTGNTDKLGGIGTESGTTNEIIRNVSNEKKGNV